jgi:hypothetical protein
MVANGSRNDSDGLAADGLRERGAEAMTAGICVLTHRPEPDGTQRPRRTLPGLLLCGGHLERLRHQLVGGEHRNSTSDLIITRGLPWLDQELARSHQAHGPQADRISGSTHEAPIPARLTITELRFEMYQKPHSWARLVCGERDLAPWRHTTLANACAFLDTHSGWLAGQDFADEIANEISDLHTRAWQAIDPTHQDVTERQIPGSCHEPTACNVHTRDVLRCGAPITAHLDRRDSARSKICCTADPEHQTAFDRWYAWQQQHGAAS